MPENDYMKWNFPNYTHLPSISVTANKHTLIFSRKLSILTNVRATINIKKELIYNAKNNFIGHGAGFFAHHGICGIRRSI